MVIIANGNDKKNVLFDKNQASSTKQSVWSSQFVGSPSITLPDTYFCTFHVKFISISLTVTVIV